MDGLLKRFREKLTENGQSLKWWHLNYAPKDLKYNYFIRQINTAGALQDNLARAIGEYVGE